MDRDPETGHGGAPARGAASVVAVVVTHDAGPELEPLLASLAGQDFDRLSVLVIDAASPADPTPRVAAALPSAFVRRLDDNPGFGPAASLATEMVEGASFLLFCHDDVVLDQDAVRLLVDEAYRTNAGIVGPKLVEWDEPDHLLDVGIGADKIGRRVDLVETGEVDQEQHDAVRDVFVIPGACTLVRADLFDTLRGFDPGIDLFGEDLDLCWRAQVAGARVVVAPAARARHLRRRSGEARPEDSRRRSRHRLRTVLTCYGVFHLLRVVPQAVVVSVVESLRGVVTVDPRRAVEPWSAWAWNLRRFRGIIRRRSALKRIRRLGDREVRRGQIRGLAGLAALLSARSTSERGLSTASRNVRALLRAGPSRTSVLVWLTTVLVLAVGTRDLITDALPAVGEFATFPSGPSSLVREWFSGWRSAGLGSNAPAPTAFAFLGAAGYLLLGGMGLLQKLLVLGLLPLGLFGAWRLSAPLASARARATVLIVYAVVPLPYNALAAGHWRGLALYAAAPWLWAGLAYTIDREPFVRGQGARPRARALALGLSLAIVAALAPLAVVVVALIAVGLALGSLLVGDLRSAGRVVAVGSGAALVAAILHLPWTFDFVTGRAEWTLVGAIRAETSAVDLGQMLRFETGPIGAAPLGFALLVVAAVPLLVARGPRFAWAVRSWAVAMVSWAILWAGGLGWLPVDLPTADLVLAAAAASMALAAGLGVSAFEHDVAAGSFGLRQFVAVLGVGALGLATIPVLGAAFDGSWNAPEGDYAPTLAFLAEDAADAPFRVLWVGDPEVVPVAGREMTFFNDTATTENGLPTVRDQWSASATDATDVLRAAVASAEAGETKRLGRLLGPMGIRYVVVVEQLAPRPFVDEVFPGPPGFQAALIEQLDLEEIEVNPAVQVYRNTAWGPSRTLLPGGAGAPAEDESVGEQPLAQAFATDFSDAPVALSDREGYASFAGDVTAGQDLYLAASPAGDWVLSVEGQSVAGRPEFGVGAAFTVPADGRATLAFDTPATRVGLLGAQVLLWIGAVALVARDRARDSRMSSEPRP